MILALIASIAVMILAAIAVITGYRCGLDEGFVRGMDAAQELYETEYREGAKERQPAIGTDCSWMRGDEDEY